MACEVKIVQTLNPDTLKQVAVLLKIPEADHDKVISASVTIRTTPPPPRRRPARPAAGATSRRRK